MQGITTEERVSTAGASGKRGDAGNILVRAQDAVLDRAEKVENRFVRPLTDKETTTEVLFATHIALIALILVGMRSSENIIRDAKRAALGVALVAASVLLLDSMLVDRFPGVMSYVALGTGATVVTSTCSTLWSIAQHHMHHRNKTV